MMNKSSVTYFTNQANSFNIVLKEPFYELPCPIGGSEKRLLKSMIFQRVIEVKVLHLCNSGCLTNYLHKPFGLIQSPFREIVWNVRLWINMWIHQINIELTQAKAIFKVLCDLSSRSQLGRWFIYICQGHTLQVMLRFNDATSSKTQYLQNMTLGFRFCFYDHCWKYE